LGKAASLMPEDIWVFGIVALSSLLLIFIFFKPLYVMSFDINYAQSIGLPIKFLENLLSFLLIVSVATCIQAVGVVLSAALLITPPIAARYWTNNLKTLLFLSIFISVLASLSGTWVSYQWSKMPTGPWIVVFLSIFVFFSIFFNKLNLFGTKLS
jgi:manganese/zinc/iron transport system permease protein